MVYKHDHKGCVPGCKVHTAYIRIKSRWLAVGRYATTCGRFTPSSTEPTERQARYENFVRFEKEKEELWRKFNNMDSSI